MDETYDVVVAGGGAAGLSGALALARAQRSVLVVDAGEPRNAPAGYVHNYLAREGTPPAELVAAGRDEVRLASGEVVALDAVVVSPPLTARADVLESLGLKPLDTSCPTCPGFPNGGAATCCTAPTATGGRSAAGESASWLPARWRRIRRTYGSSGART